MGQKSNAEVREILNAHRRWVTRRLQLPMEMAVLQSRLVWRSVEPAVFVQLQPADSDYVWFDVSLMVHQWGTPQAEIFFKLVPSMTGFLAAGLSIMPQYSLENRENKKKVHKAERFGQRHLGAASAGQNEGPSGLPVAAQSLSAGRRVFAVGRHSAP